MPDSWKTIADISAITENDGISVKLEGREVAIFLSNGEFYAIDNKCTHAAAPLVDGYLSNNVIECPVHQGLFCVKTGKALASPATRDLRSYPVQVVSGKVQIKLTDLG